MAARMAISAVSPSRISPTATMSGSWRWMERRPLENVRPVFSLICTWLVPSMLYSTGSSNVMSFTCSVLSSRIIVYMVDDLPEPVGPAISSTPLFECTSFSYFSRFSPYRPMPFGSSSWVLLSNRRTTTDSP